jgi:hypothetical protein
MKTIKNKQTGKVKRIREKDAKQILQAGWVYCPKSEFKKIKV